VGVPVVTPDGDLARSHLQSGEQRRGAVAHVVVGAFPRPGRSGNMGAVRSKAWIWLFWSTHRTIPFSGESR
jgi:hypothetical protein